MIGTNKKCSQDTVDTVLGDLAVLDAGPAGLSGDCPDKLAEWLESRQPKLVTAAHWQAIDRFERQAGEELPPTRQSGRPDRAPAGWARLMAGGQKRIARRKETPMTYVIAEPCVDIKDKACIEECPVDCIYEGARMLYIHPDECVDCGACEPVCPVESIYYEDDLPGEYSEYTQINVDFFDELGSPGGAAKIG